MEISRAECSVGPTEHLESPNLGEDTMAPVTKRRRVEDEVRRPKKKKVFVKRQKTYHSSSEDEGDELVEKRQEEPQNAEPKSILKRSTPAKSKPTKSQPAEKDEEASTSEIEGLSDLDEAQRNAVLNAAPNDTLDDSENDDENASEEEADVADSEINDNDTEQSSASDNDNDEDALSLTSSQASTIRKKRNDPSAFGTSISRILDTKLTATKRKDPVLSRSRLPTEANAKIEEGKIDTAARAQIRAERKAALNKGRITDLLGLEDGSVETGKVVEEERKLQKVAQRGVVKLFNAVRAAQVGAEKAEREARGGDGGGGVVGRKAREERVSEMSKEGFLDMISKGRGAAASAGS